MKAQIVLIILLFISIGFFGQEDKITIKLSPENIEKPLESIFIIKDKNKVEEFILKDEKSKESFIEKTAALFLTNQNKKIDLKIDSTRCNLLIDGTETKFNFDNLISRKLFIKLLEEQYNYKNETLNIQDNIAIIKEDGETILEFNLSNKDAKKRFNDYLIEHYNNDNTEQIGTFNFIKEVDLYEKLNVKKELKIKIKEIQIYIDEGVITQVQVETEDGRLFVNKNPISIQRYNRSSKQKLREKWNNSSKEFIFLNDVLTYKPRYGSRFVPDYTNFTLSNEETKKEILIGNNLKTLIDFRIYSDFFSLIDESANGLVSFEGNAKVFILPSNLKNYNTFLFKSINPYLNFSKFDNDLKEVKTIENGSLFKVKDKLTMIQKSFLTAGLNLELVSFKFRNYHSFKFKLPFVGQYNIAKLDSLSTNKNIQSVTYGPGVNVSFKKTTKFGLNVGAFYLWNHHLYNSNQNIERIKDFNTLKITSELFLYPQGKANNVGAIFLRLNYNTLIKKNEDSNYFQLQFGYKADLNFSKKKLK